MSRDFPEFLRVSRDFPCFPGISNAFPEALSSFGQVVSPHKKMLRCLLSLCTQHIDMAPYIKFV